MGLVFTHFQDIEVKVKPSGEKASIWLSSTGPAIQRSLAQGVFSKYTGLIVVCTTETSQV